MKQKRISRRLMKLTKFYRMQKSARNTMPCGLNTSSGSKRTVASRISTGKIGQANQATGRTSNMPTPKIWKIFSEAIRHIPTSSHSIFGQAGRSSRSKNRAASPSPRRGRDVEYEVDLTLEESFHCANRLLEIDGYRIQASIPPGVRTGSRVRLAGQGEPGRNSGPAGDLYLAVNVLPNEIFERDGDDLHLEVPVDIFIAICWRGNPGANPGAAVDLEDPTPDKFRTKFPSAWQGHAPPA